MSNTQLPYVTQKKFASFALSSARSKQIRALLPMIGGVSAAIFMVLWFGWAMISPKLSRSNQEAVLQSAWPDNEAVQQFPSSSSPTLLLTDSNVSTQAAENTDVPILQKSSEIPLLKELAQINVRLERLEERNAALKLVLQKMITNVELKQSLAKRPIATQRRVRQTRHMPQMSQLPLAKGPPRNTPATQSRKTNQQLIKPVPQPILQLKAVLEGRAWLQTQSGASITVAVGELVPEVGIVKAIDVEQGKVIFSNGVVLP